MPLNNWLVDADNLNLNRLNKDKYIFKNGTIDSFITGSRSVVCAPKGFGKTLLLKYVSNKYSNKKGLDAIRIPQDREIDYFQQAIDTHKAIISQSDSNAWRDYWVIAIGLSIIANYAIKTQDAFYIQDFVEQIHKELGQLNLTLSIIKQIGTKLKLGDEISRQTVVRINPTEILSLLLQESPEDLFQAKSRLLVAVRQSCSVIERPVVMFIDKVDQGFEELPLTAWANAQNGLAQAVYHIRAMNSQFKIFASIRKEAWAVFVHPLRMQYSDNITEIRYSNTELENIFKNAITTFENKKTTKHPNEFDSNPVKAFSGFDTITNEWAGVGETAVGYLIRYSMGRPRDLMMLGYQMHEHINELEEDRFKTLVGEITSLEVQSSYLAEVEKFTKTGITNEIANVFKFVNSNILTKKQLEDACYEYNKRNVDVCIAREGASCSSCQGAEQVFTDLYAIGLLGIVVHDEDLEEENLQKFSRIGDYSGEALPQSEWYILHPSLKWCVKKANTRYRAARGILTGNGLPWKKEYADKIRLNWLITEAKAQRLFDDNLSERLLSHLRIKDDANKAALKDFDEAKKRLSLSDANTASSILSNGVKIIDTFYKWIA